MKNFLSTSAQVFLFLCILTTSSSSFAQSSNSIVNSPTAATIPVSATPTPIEETSDEIIKVKTDSLQTAVLSVRSKGTDWTVSLNDQPVTYQKVAVTEVNLTIFIEAEESFDGIESFAISQELKKLRKNKAVRQVEVCIVGASKSKLRFAENWKVTSLPDLEKAGEYFWQKPELNKALLIISKKKTGYISDLDILKQLEAWNKNQSALIYYLTPEAVVSAKKKQPVAWCNLYWQDIWIASPDAREFIKKQFDVFEEMLAGYYIFYCDLPDAGADVATLKIKGVETASGDQVALQTKTVKKGE